MTEEIIVRTYAGENQWRASQLYAEDAPRLAEEGWVPVTQAWVADDWPMSAYIASGLLVIVGIGIALLIVFAFYKPVRTLMVTYHRASSAASVATGAAANG